MGYDRCDVMGMIGVMFNLGTFAIFHGGNVLSIFGEHDKSLV